MKSLTLEQKSALDAIIAKLRDANFKITPRAVWEAMFSHWSKELPVPHSYDVAEYVRSLNHG